LPAASTATPCIDAKRAAAPVPSVDPCTQRGVEKITDIDVQRGIDRNGNRLVERCHADRAVRTAGDRRRTREGRYDGGGRDLADYGVRFIGDEQRPGWINRQTGWRREARGRPGAIRETGQADAPRDRRDHTGGADLAQDDVRVPSAVHGDRRRQVERRCGTDPVGGPGDTGSTGHRSHHAGGRDQADRVVRRIGNEQTAGCSDRQIGRRVELRGRAASIGRADHAMRSGEGRDDACRGDFADRVVAGIGYVDIASHIGCEADRRIERCGCAGAVGESDDADRTSEG
jgi:hypothetical protein